MIDVKWTEIPCVACAKGMVKLTAKAGRREWQRSVELEVPADFEIPTCTHCGEEYMNGEIARELDKALMPAYEERIRQLFTGALERLLEITGPTDLERKLGLSQGYLARIKAGTVTPSQQLVAMLASFARDPKKRLRELEETWQLP